jgi:hypothetical protein
VNRVRSDCRSSCLRLTRCERLQNAFHLAGDIGCNTERISAPL